MKVEDLLDGLFDLAVDPDFGRGGHLKTPGPELLNVAGLTGLAG